jgi:hypothetical protein
VVSLRPPYERAFSGTAARRAYLRSTNVGKARDAVYVARLGIHRASGVALRAQHNRITQSLRGESSLAHGPARVPARATARATASRFPTSSAAVGGEAIGGRGPDGAGGHQNHGCEQRTNAVQMAHGDFSGRLARSGLTARARFAFVRRARGRGMLHRCQRDIK